MNPKQWFLIVIKNGTFIVKTDLLDSYDEAMSIWKKNPSWTICETVYG